MLPAAKPQHLAASGILKRVHASKISRSATSLHFSPVRWVKVRNPDFLLRSPNHGTRVRLSVRKAA